MTFLLITLYLASLLLQRKNIDLIYSTADVELKTARNLKSYCNSTAMGWWKKEMTDDNIMKHFKHSNNGSFSFFFKLYSAFGNFGPITKFGHFQARPLTSFYGPILKNRF